MTTATVTTIRQLIRERIMAADEPDPHVIAEALAAEAGEEMAREALSEALLTLVRLEMGSLRRRKPSPVPSEKWAGYSTVLRSVFDKSFPTADGSWKFLGDFTRDDALFKQQNYEQGAAELLHHAQQFSVLARKLKKGQTARELGEQTVGEIFNA